MLLSSFLFALQQQLLLSVSLSSAEIRLEVLFHHILSAENWRIITERRKKTISVVPEKKPHTLVCRVVKRAKKRVDAKPILEKCSSLRMPTTTLLIGATHLFTCYFYVGMSVLMVLP